MTKDKKLTSIFLLMAGLPKLQASLPDYGMETGFGQVAGSLMN